MPTLTRPLATHLRFHLHPQRLPLGLPGKRTRHLDIRRPLRHDLLCPTNPLHIRPRPRRALLLLKVRHQHLLHEHDSRLFPGPHRSECKTSERTPCQKDLCKIYYLPYYPFIVRAFHSAFYPQLLRKLTHLLSPYRLSVLLFLTGGSRQKKTGPHIQRRRPRKTRRQESRREIGLSKTKRALARSLAHGNQRQAQATTRNGTELLAIIRGVGQGQGQLVVGGLWGGALFLDTGMSMSTLSEPLCRTHSPL